MPISSILDPPLDRDQAGGVITAIGNAVAVVIAEGAVENLPVVDDAVVVAVGGPFDDPSEFVQYAATVRVVVPSGVWPGVIT